MKKDLLFDETPSVCYDNKRGRCLNGNSTNVRVISTISHEFRTPLAVIHSNLQLIKSFKNNINHESLEDVFELCEGAVNNMARILEDIAWLNKSNKGAMHVRLSSFSLNKFIHNLFKEFSTNVDITGLDYRPSIEEERIVSDKNLLRQVILNLLSNAFKFSSQEVIVVVVQDVTAKELSMSIEDKGIGISKDEIKNILDPFFRGKNTRKIAGTGLGLSIVYECIKALNGQLKVDSILEYGTKFTFTIPYEKEKSDFSN